MNTDDFEKRMREHEHYHEWRVLPGAWIVLRVDGRGFSRLTKSRYTKPFDSVFHTQMVETAQALLRELHGIYAYTESDEISVLLRKDTAIFDREVEKLVSISAGVASATFTHASGTLAHFDSRLWLGVDAEDVVDYFRWRQEDAARCALSGWCYWTLRQEGNSVDVATKALRGLSVAEKNELLFQRGINYNDVPLWQRRGSGLYWETYEKPGFDPAHQVSVATARRRLKVDEALPMKEAYAAFVYALLAEASPGQGTVSASRP